MKRRNLVQEYFDQKIVCGGILYTRLGLYLELKEEGYSHDRLDFIIGIQKEATEEKILGAINMVPNVYPEEIRRALKGED